jgi:adhesin transport system membrane fusion protein
LQESLVLAREELGMNQRLFEGGDISRSEVMRAERQVLDIQARANAARNKYLSDARTELARLEDERTTSQQKLNERENVLQHTDMTSPMDGVVKVVRITTVGGVLKPGDELMQISPADDELLLEIKVNPADVGQLRLGLPVSLRFDAFDSSIFGKLNGTLRYISPDTLVEQGANNQSTTFYRAQVAIDWDASTPNQRIRAQDIKPGMTATADVLTGERSILNYLLKPVTRAFSGAMLQR